MGKRSDFEKVEKDKYYTTDFRAVAPLIDFVAGCTYYEPCAGNGDLINLLVSAICLGSSDEELDARTTKYDTKAEYFITNPPWTRNLLHPIIENLRGQKPTWLLFDSDWMFTKQSEQYIKYCEKIIAVGRVRWIADSKYDGKDNCAWYFFVDHPTTTQFFGRAEL